MKNKIYFLGALTSSVLIVGCMFKIMHWPGAGVILTVSILTLILLFFPIALRNSYKANGSRKGMLYLSAFITLFFAFLAALFKTMHWPGASIILSVGLLLPIVLFLPVYLYFHFREKEESLNNFLYIIFFLVGLSGISAYLGLDISRHILVDITRIYSVSDLSRYYEIKDEQVKSEYTGAEVREVIDKSATLLQEIDEMKKQLVLKTYEQNDVAIRNGNEILAWKIPEKYSKEATQAVLVENGEGNLLMKGIRNYHDFLISLPGIKDNNTLQFIPALEPLIRENQHSETWMGDYVGTPMMMLLLKFSEVEDCIRLAEMEALNMLNKNKPESNIMGT